MALKAVYDTEDLIPDTQRDLYTERDGKFVLDIGDDELRQHPSAKALKNALDREKEQRRQFSEKLTAAEARLEGLPEDFNADEYQRLKDGAKDGESIDARLTAQRTQLEAQKAAEIKKRDDRIATVEGALKKKIVDDGLTQALIDAGIDPQHLKMVKRSLATIVKTEEDDGEFHAVVDTDTDPHMPLLDYVKAWASDEGKRYIAVPVGTGATGSDSRKGEVNPWAKETSNLTQQGQIVSTNPTQARRLMKAAGKSDAEIHAAGVAA